MGPAAARPPPRKRVRKRKRRAVSLSSSSSSSSDSESDETIQPKVPVAPQRIPQPEESSSSSSSSSESSSSEEEDESEPERDVQRAESTKPRAIRQASRSPSPPSAEIPSFLQGEARETEEQVMKAKFRKFWMASVADGFKDDLEEIRKEQNLGASRLAVLIESLAAGGDVFSGEEVM